MHVPVSLFRSTLATLLTLTLGLAATPAAALTTGLANATDPVPATPLPYLFADPELVTLVSRMTHRSPTFARLCARLAQTRGLYLRMRVEGPTSHGRYVARSVIRRHEYGALVADVVLHAPLDPVEVIAHELEHVLEQVERVDLRQLSVVRGSGVFRLWNGDFETTRAVTTGRRVAAEFGDATASVATTEPDDF